MDEVRLLQFGKADVLPPTSDTAVLHIKRSHYYTSICKQAHLQDMNLPPVESCGWSLTEGQWKPILTTLDAIPKACLELVTCACKKTGCATQLCKCKGNGLYCVPGLCKCKNCTNTDEVDDD